MLRKLTLRVNAIHDSAHTTRLLIGIQWRRLSLERSHDIDGSEYSVGRDPDQSTRRPSSIFMDQQIRWTAVELPVITFTVESASPSFYRGRSRDIHPYIFTKG